jgi:hypothetical protein
VSLFHFNYRYSFRSPLKKGHLLKVRVCRNTCRTNTVTLKMPFLRDSSGSCGYFELEFEGETARILPAGSTPPLSDDRTKYVLESSPKGTADEPPLEAGRLSPPTGQD